MPKAMTKKTKTTVKQKFHCPCCGNPTYPVPPKNDIGYICDVCWWENDPFIRSDDEPSDQNHGMSLRQARNNYKKYGISAPHLLKAWRKNQNISEVAKQAEDVEKRTLSGTKVELDLNATIAWYSQGYRWGCGCDDCRNFMRLAHDMQLPHQMIELLLKLGILPEQATYVCELYPTEGGRHYQVSYRLAGRILDVPETSAPFAWGESRCCHEPYPYGAPGFPQPHFDLEFCLTLPWILEESDA